MEKCFLSVQINARKNTKQKLCRSQVCKLHAKEGTVKRGTLFSKASFSERVNTGI